MNDELKRHIDNIEVLAKDMGLDFFPVIFETVDRDIMLEACTYGLPTRSRSWVYGSTYKRTKIYGEMGFSKVYEIVFNNNPAYAYLMNNNTDIINIMVAAHVFGHSAYFKNNVAFKNSDRSMVYHAAERAARVDSYIEQYGLDKVEHFMDIGFALDNHIDWNKGIFREKYPAKQIISSVRRKDEFDDLIEKNNSKRSVVYKTTGDKLPPSPEKDLLWFFANYARLEEWEKDILSIMREESYYFWPIVTTKISNEGYACVLGNTLVYTDVGIIEMKDLVGKNSGIIYDGDSTQKICHSGIIKDKDIIRIQTKRGLFLGGAIDHKILMQDKSWKQLDEIEVGDKISISGGNNIWSNEYQKIEYSVKKRPETIEQICDKYETSWSTVSRFVNKSHKTKEKNIVRSGLVLADLDKQKNNKEYSPTGSSSRIPINIPKILDKDLAYFLGYLTGDGHITTNARSLGLTSGDEYSANHFMDISKKLFGLDATKKWDDSSLNGRWRILLYSLDLKDFLNTFFDIPTGVSARIKKIPNLILRSPKEIISAFLRSYFDCDGCACSQGVILSTSSDKLAEQTQLVLLNYGILSHRNKALDECWQVRISGKSAEVFYKEIGFGLERKQKKLKQYLDNHKFYQSEKWEDKIVKIDKLDKTDVYDITVENTHKYSAGGFINHNCFWHSELMYKYNKLTEREYFDFAKIHSGVVNPGNTFNINPYYIGFKIFTDIRERWDKLYEAGQSKIDGIHKVMEVAAEEDDASFLRNYLTKELVYKLGLFNYGYRIHRSPDMDEKKLTKEHGFIELKDRDLDKIIENIIRPTINYGAPLITINEVCGDALHMEHRDDFGPLDRKYAEKTIEYIHELWKGPIKLKTYDHDRKPFSYYFDGDGMRTRFE